MHGTAWAFTGSLTVLPRKTSNCDLLQMTRDAFGPVAERPSSGIRYLCVHRYISALMQTDDAKEAKPGFPPECKVSYEHEQVGGVAAEPLQMAPDASRWAATKDLRRGD